MARATVLVAGATGVVGHAAMEELAARGWDVVALSRRRPECTTGEVRHLAVDLRDGAAAAAAVGGLRDVTHVVYAALFEKPGLVGGWYERDQMETNLVMLRHCLEPLARASPSLRHVSLLQGTKAYGVHHHAIAVPARERWPRDPHENFYWLQEDWLRATAAAAGWTWTVFRPQIVFGWSWGTAMNLVPVIGAYAAICREEGLPFGFPGGADVVLEAVDARLLARALAWAAEAPAAANQIFNVTNGDVFVWRNVWPAIAAALDVEAASDTPRSMATFLPGHAATWDRIVGRHGLRPIRLPELLGESHHYADFCFAHGATGALPPALVSTIKLRQAGFGDCIDTEDMLRDWFRLFRQRRILP